MVLSSFPNKQIINHCQAITQRLLIYVSLEILKNLEQNGLQLLLPTECVSDRRYDLVF